MNLDQITKQLYKFVKLSPPATRTLYSGHSEQADWRWRVTAIDKKQGRVDLQSHSYGLTLMSDHIREFMRSSDSESDGFLHLKVTVSIHGNSVTVSPALTKS